MTKYKILLLFFILISLSLPAHVAFADTGPKPTMQFEFKQALPNVQVAIMSGILYECKQPDCSDATPLKELGPQRITCDTLSCSALAYGFSPYHKLEIQYSDGKTRQSNIFETAGFNSRYTVTIRSDDLLVEAQFSPTALPPTITFIPPPLTITFTPPQVTNFSSDLFACLCALAGIGLIIGLIIFIIRRSETK